MLLKLVLMMVLDGVSKMQEIELKLKIEEVNAILQTLGQLPTSSGAWPLVVKIKEQTELVLTNKSDNQP